jgi:hypothetical protein
MLSIAGAIRNIEPGLLFDWRFDLNNGHRVNHELQDCSALVVVVKAEAR